MIKYITSDNQPRIGIDLDVWRAKMLPILRQGNILYRFDSANIIEIEKLSSQLVMPILLYTLMDMYDVLKNELPHEDITKELLAVAQQNAELDAYNILKLSYEHVQFINNHEDEVKAWLPIIIKRYVTPNYLKIKDVLNGNIHAKPNTAR